MNSIIRWAGSKRQLLTKLSCYWPKDAKRYVEPFCGSACLFFHLEPPKAILGDLNSELISTYKALKRDPLLVCEYLKRLQKGRNAYYRIRAIAVDSLSEAEVAARFLYLNRYCFNGIYRTNRLGKFNVPYGRPKSDNDFEYESIQAAARILKRVSFVDADFQETLKRVEKGDFVYLDPPFAVSQRRVFAEYHPAAFSLNDLERLQDCLIKLDRKGIPFVISYADSREARLLLERWKYRRVRTRRYVAGFAAHRRNAYELLATNLKELSHDD